MRAGPRGPDCVRAGLWPMRLSLVRGDHPGWIILPDKSPGRSHGLLTNYQGQKFYTVYHGGRTNRARRGTNSKSMMLKWVLLRSDRRGPQEAGTPIPTD